MIAAKEATCKELTEAQIEHFNREGFLIRKGLFSRTDAMALAQRFMDMRAAGSIPHYGASEQERLRKDSLLEFPRVMHPHRWDEQCRQWLLNPRIADTLRGLLREEPIAAQSMFYFKPPGARGQSLHQDNFYLRVKPKTCIAAWVALDRCDPDNGGLQVVPGSHTLEVACPEEADPKVSFARHLVRPPQGMQPVPAIMDPGDTLFFNGSVIHGSTPNTSKTRFRRSIIFHYGPESMKEISHGYKPLLSMSGQVVEREDAIGGGPCGGEVSEGGASQNDY